MNSRPLFGGAISSMIPPQFEDISMFRDVPDNQEVFADAATDQAIMVEILEQEPVSDALAARHYFDDLAEFNESRGHNVVFERMLAPEEMPNLSADIPKLLLVGEQNVSKFKEEMATNRVRVYMVVVRLNDKQTDILITLNAPQEIHDLSSSAIAGAVAPSPDYSNAVLSQVLQTFAIHDYTLFG
eukprot:GILK01006494.1.p1 GENE.GILK01006494.1~~GILK01006494.1.p1  ORF type:complete len:207 (+),score=35.51 GILK01006494.1:68-622(+)